MLIPLKVLFAGALAFQQEPPIGPSTALQRKDAPPARILEFRAQPESINAGEPVILIWATEYEAVIEDPNVFQAPWVVARNFSFRPEFDLVDEFVCENNRDYRDLFEKK
jgi:hypothetical protein